MRSTSPSEAKMALVVSRHPNMLCALAGRESLEDPDSSIGVKVANLTSIILTRFS